MPKTLAILVLLPLSLFAREISTSHWGDIWPRSPGWQEEISPTNTPGADSFKFLRFPVVTRYAFFDAYDVRSNVATRSCAPTLSSASSSSSSSDDPPGENYARNATNRFRFVDHAQYLARKNKLRDLECGTGDIWWGSTALDALFPDTIGYPIALPFSWTSDPTTRVYNNGTGWLPAFRSLLPSYDWPNDAYDRSWPGIAIDTAWPAVSFHEQGGFASFLKHAELEPTDVKAFPTNITFDAVLSNVFDTACTTGAISRNTYRFYTPMEVATHRTLALFDKTMRVAPDLVAVTNYVRGDAIVGYRSEGSIGAEVHVQNPCTPYEEIWIGDDRTGPWHILPDWSSTSAYTNHIDTTNMPCSLPAPRLRVSTVGKHGGVSGFLKDAIGGITVEKFDQQFIDAMIQVFEYNPGASTVDVTLNASFSGNTAYLDLMSTMSEFPVSISYTVQSSGEAALEVPIYGTATAEYSFQKALDITVTTNGVPYAFYPVKRTLVNTNLTTLTYLEYTVGHFFSGVAFCSRNKNLLGNVDFGYGEGGNLDWYGGNPAWDYRYNRLTQAARTDYLENLSAELRIAAAKIATYASEYDADAVAYTDFTAADAERLVSAYTNWTPYVKMTLLGQEYDGMPVSLSATFTRAFDEERGVYFESDVFPIALVSIGVGLTATGGGGATNGLPVSVDSKIKAIQEARWAFPQFTLSNQ